MREVTLHIINMYISSVYSKFSDMVGIPLHNNPSSGVLMKSIRRKFLQPDNLLDIKHMCVK